MKKLFILLILIACILVSYGQTVKEDLQLLLEKNKIEDVELIEYLKSRINNDFLQQILEPRSNSKRLILNQLANYLDANIVYDESGWLRLVPYHYKLYQCEVYSHKIKLVFSVPAYNDQEAYATAEKAFKRVHTETVIKIIINEINTKKVKP